MESKRIFCIGLQIYVMNESKCMIIINATLRMETLVEREMNEIEKYSKGGFNDITVFY